MATGSDKYEIVLSFAGEDREYVEQVAEILRSSNVRVFYDAYEEVTLWGRDLYQHLADVYSNSRYCVIFLSAAYANKLWTRHELKNAQARAFREQREYILPARFDNTEIPGMLETVAYIDLRTKKPNELAQLILSKISEKPNGRGTEEVKPQNPPSRAIPFPRSRDQKRWIIIPLVVLLVASLIYWYLQFFQNRHEFRAIQSAWSEVFNAGTVRGQGPTGAGQTPPETIIITNLGPGVLEMRNGHTHSGLGFLSARQSRKLNIPALDVKCNDQVCDGFYQIKSWFNIFN